MALEISLSIYNARGSIAELVDEKYGKSVTLSLSKTTDAALVCHAAAAHLRFMAHKFELLADEAEPFKKTTQHRVMRSIGKKVI